MPMPTPQFDRELAAVVNSAYWYSLPLEQRWAMQARLVTYEDKESLPSDLALVVSICLRSDSEK